MLSFRRSLIVALSVLGLFFFFFSGPKKMSPKSLLPNGNLEQEILKVRQDTEYALKELQHSTVENIRLQEKKIEQLEEERRNLVKKLKELDKPPSSASLREQLAFQFPYEISKKFPAYIWQTWKHDLDDPNFESGLKKTVHSWSDKNEGFVHEVLGDSKSRVLIKHLYKNVPKVIEAYEAMPETILKADFFRYLILLSMGGTYSDVDTQALQPVPNWIPDNVDPMKLGLIIGIEADPDRPDWDKWYSRRIQFCQWTIQSKPGHPALRDIVARITEKTLQKKTANELPLPSTTDRGSVIMDWTGPGIWTDTIFDYFNDHIKSGLYYPVGIKNFTGMTEPKSISDVLVLPITSFSPGIETMGAESEHHPYAFVKHQFEGSWKPENERHIGGT